MRTALLALALDAPRRAGAAPFLGPFPDWAPRACEEHMAVASDVLLRYAARAGDAAAEAALERFETGLVQLAGVYPGMRLRDERGRPTARVLRAFSRYAHQQLGAGANAGGIAFAVAHLAGVPRWQLDGVAHDWMVYHGRGAAARMPRLDPLEDLARRRQDAPSAGAAGRGPAVEADARAGPRDTCAPAARLRRDRCGNLMAPGTGPPDGC